MGRTAKKAAEPVADKKPMTSTENLEKVAAFDMVIKGLQAVRDRYADRIAPEAFGRFYDKVQADGTQHDKTYKIREGRAKGEAALRRKDGRSPLKSPDIAKLTEAGIVLAAPTGNRLQVNKAYLTDEKVLAKLDDYLSKPGATRAGIPSDFLEAADVKIVVDDDLVWSVLGLKDFQKAVSLLPVIGTVNINKTEITGEKPFDHALQIVLDAIPEAEELLDLD